VSDDDRRGAEARAFADLDGTLHEAILAGRPIDPVLAERVVMLDFRDRSELTDLGFVEHLPRLCSLDLTGTGVRDLAPLAAAQRLARLTLMRTAVDDLSPLAHLPALAALNIDRTAVDDLSPLAGSTTLERLDIGPTPIADLAPLGRLPNLTVLDIGAASALRRLDLSGFPALATLVGVSVADATLWPAEFPDTLRELILGGAAWPVGRPLPDLPRLITPDWRLIDDGEPCSDPFAFWRLVCLAEDEGEDEDAAGETAETGGGPGARGHRGG
jgi:hypothetical protein